MSLTSRLRWRSLLCSASANELKASPSRAISPLPRPVLDLRLAIAAPALGAAIGVMAGAFPSWRACRVEPIAALRAM
jgi:hypothetical protein